MHFSKYRIFSEFYRHLLKVKNKLKIVENIRKSRRTLESLPLEFLRIVLEKLAKFRIKTILFF